MGAIIDAIVSLLEWIAGRWLGRKQAEGVAQGRAEAQRDTEAAAAKTEADIAQAEADSPRTEAEALKRLRDGTA